MQKSGRYKNWEKGMILTQVSKEIMIWDWLVISDIEKDKGKITSNAEPGIFDKEDEERGKPLSSPSATSANAILFTVS